MHHWPFSQFKWHSFAGGKHASHSKLEAVRPDGHLDILAVTSPKLQISFGDGKGGFAAPVTIPQSGIPAIGPTVVADSLAIMFGFFAAGIVAAGKNARRCSAVFGLIALALFVASCGGGNGTQPTPTVGTPSGFSHITVTDNSSAIHSTALDVTVTP